MEEASLPRIIFIDLPVYLLSYWMWYSLKLPHYNDGKPLSNGQCCNTNLKVYASTHNHNNI